MNFEVIPFLSLNGKAAAAIAFYEKYLGAKVLFKKNYKEMKEMSPNFHYEKGQDEYITHSVLEIGVNKLMIAEEAMDRSRPWQLGNSFSFCIQTKDEDVIKALYESLIQSGSVTVLEPLQENVFSQDMQLSEIHLESLYSYVSRRKIFKGGFRDTKAIKERLLFKMIKRNVQRNDAVRFLQAFTQLTSLNVD